MPENMIKKYREFRVDVVTSFSDPVPRQVTVKTYPQHPFVRNAILFSIF